MTGETEEGGGSEALRRAQAIDAICDRFEAALKEGDADLRAEIEKAETAARPELFKQLLGLQLSLAPTSQARPDVPELIAEFPEFAEEINRQLAGEDQTVRTIRSQLPASGAASEEVLREIQAETRYQVGGEVARGGMGAIHLAEEPSLRRNVAVKTMLMESATPDETARFIEEAQITGQLDHPGIVPVHELGVDEDGRPFYSMKFVRGRDLHAVLGALRDGDAAAAAEFPLHRLLTVFDRVCDAVAFAHAHGVIHRDLKPANIRVGEFGEVYLMDWGLAKLSGRTDPQRAERSPTVKTVRGEDESGEFLTLAGTVMGSPQYMAPEQAGGAVPIDQRADIYALGAILYEIIALRPPIQPDPGEDLAALIKRVAESEIEDLMAIGQQSPGKQAGAFTHLPGKRVPAALAQVAMKALSRDRDARYRTVGELQKEISAWMGGFATEAEEAGLLRQVKLFIGRNRIASAAACLITLTALAGGVLTFKQRDRAIAALSDYKRSQLEKREQAKSSAPAYLKSAHILEVQGEFDDALLAVERSLDFDPELPEALRSRVLLLVRGARYAEARTAAEALVSATPNEDESVKLRDLVSGIESSPSADQLTAIAEFAEFDGARSATYRSLMEQARDAYAVEFAPQINAWRAQIDRAWPGVGDSLDIEGAGLTITLYGAGGDAPPVDLSPLRGIPISKLTINGTDLAGGFEPIRSLPIRELTLHDVPVSTLVGVEDLPLQQLSISGFAHPDPEFFTALQGKDLFYLSLACDPGVRFDTTPLSAVQIRHFLSASFDSLSGIEFLKHQDSLEALELRSVPHSGDLTPALSCPSLQNFHGDWRVLHTVFHPALQSLAEDDLEAALAELDRLKELTVAPALDRTVATIDLLKFLVAKKLGQPTRLRENKTLFRRSGTKAFAILALAPQSVSPDSDIDLNAALTSIDSSLASIGDIEENKAIFDLIQRGKYSSPIWTTSQTRSAVQFIGAHYFMTAGIKDRGAGDWKWANGEDWEFAQPIQNAGAGDPSHVLGIDGIGGWQAIDPATATGIIIQFPAALLGAQDDGEP